MIDKYIWPFSLSIKCQILSHTDVTVSLGIGMCLEVYLV